MNKHITIKVCRTASFTRYAEIMRNVLLTLLLIFGTAGFSTNSHPNSLENIRVGNSIRDDGTAKKTVAVNREEKKADKKEKKTAKK